MGLEGFVTQIIKKLLQILVFILNMRPLRPRTAFKQTASMIHVLKFHDSKPKSDQFDRSVAWVYPVFPAKYRDSSTHRPWPLPSTLISIKFSGIRPAFRCYVI